MNSSKLLLKKVFVVLSFFVVQHTCAQYTPSDLSDIVEIRASSGETTMNQRGYVLRHTETSDDSKYQYWWNASKHQCVTIRVYDGRYSSIMLTGNFDCNTQPVHTSSITGKTPPSEVADLLDARASSGEYSLSSRGYTLTHTSQGNDRIYNYWWNNSKKQCLCVITKDGRYAALDPVSSADCNQNSAPNHTVKKDKTGAKVAVGAGAAAAIIGAAVLLNKSHHHDNNKHYDDAHDEAAFEAGYRDGMYSHSYHNYFTEKSQSDAYAKGYDSGVGQRTNDTQHSSGYSGTKPHINVRNLRGASANWASDQLRNDGFKLVDNAQTGNQRFLFYYNKDTKQCVMVTEEDNVYRDLADGAYNRNCK